MEAVIYDFICTENLNLQPHPVRESSTNTLRHVKTAADVEIHKGYDGRFYIIDTARLLPPEAPSPK